MNLRNKAHKEAEVFTDSLNDIIFILLMFFLIVATLANPNVVKVGLPRELRIQRPNKTLLFRSTKTRSIILVQQKLTIP